MSIHYFNIFNKIDFLYKTTYNTVDVQNEINMALDEMIQMEDLTKAFKVARTTIYEWMKTKDFPKPFKIGHKNFWRKSEIESYLESTRK